MLTVWQDWHEWWRRGIRITSLRQGFGRQA